MRRREFLRAALGCGALYGCAALGAGRARAAGFAPLADRVLVNVVLDGGLDFRYLLPPAFSPDPDSYAYRHWEAMAPAHAIEDHPDAWDARWQAHYLPRQAGASQFGILASCGWLARMWDAGHVAVVSNVLASSSRNHQRGLQALEQGDRDAGPSDANRPGWGGRLAVAAGGNVLALTRAPRPFTYGPDPADPDGHDNAVVVPAPDTRQFGLYEPPAGTASTQPAARMARALRAYYAAKREEMPETSPYRRLLDLEQRLRQMGAPVEQRLQGVPLPAAIAELYGENGLASPYFGEQIRNLHDSLAASDILSLRVASLEYLGFDTHKDQAVRLDAQLNDLFGDGRALDVLWRHLPAGVCSKLLFVFVSEFGRQIRANGGLGTDHGEGTAIVLVGESVRGGVYGDMFPQAEIARLDDASPQITGRTGLERVLGAVCDWVTPGGGDLVFPGRELAPLEPGLDPKTLLA